MGDCFCGLPRQPLGNRRRRRACHRAYRHRVHLRRVARGERVQGSLSRAADSLQAEFDAGGVIPENADTEPPRPSEPEIRKSYEYLDSTSQQCAWLSYGGSAMGIINVGLQLALLAIALKP
jgi:hypothetical protein